MITIEHDRLVFRFPDMHEHAICSIDLQRTLRIPDDGKNYPLAPGGCMRQEIYDGPYGLDAWDQRHWSRCFATIANSTQWMAITAERPLTEPPTAEDYARRGLPWFDYYDADAKLIEGAEKLGKIRSVRETDESEETRAWKKTWLGETPRVRQLGPRRSRHVREARF